VRLTHIVWIAVGAIAGLAGAFVIGRIRRDRTSAPGPDRQEVGWDLLDDFTQAAANALPHESGAFGKS